MAAKHFFSDPQKLVEQALKGVVQSDPRLALQLPERVVYCKPPQNIKRLSLISGGGAGHEPSFTGFVGAGMLDACVVGNIFASPSAKQIIRGFGALDDKSDVLVIVMNYTGDVLNFGVAIEKFKVQHPSRKVKMLVIGDDVGVPRTQASKVGRRGIAGTVLVHKIVGATAALGYSLDDAIKVGRSVVEHLVSLGVSLGRVSVPGRHIEEKDITSPAISEAEIGMGIHNEAGCEKLANQNVQASTVIRKMLVQLLNSSDPERGYLKYHSEKVVLMVNNLGGLSNLELHAVLEEAVSQLQQEYGISPIRVYVGTFMTSLNALGFSLTLLEMFETGLEHDLLTLLDHTCEAVAWKRSRHLAVKSDSLLEETQILQPSSSEQDQWIPSRRAQSLALPPSSTQFLQNALKKLIQCEPEITRYDEIVGDGDCGTTLKRGAEGE